MLTPPLVQKEEQSWVAGNISIISLGCDKDVAKLRVRIKDLFSNASLS